MRERKHFIREDLRGEYSVSELCRRFGISRNAGHKWLGRFYTEGGADPNVLEDRSRRPHSHPRAAPQWLEEAIVAARKQRPRWGPKKLRASLARGNPSVELPAESTFAKIFHRHGLVRPRRRHRRTPPGSTALRLGERWMTLPAVDLVAEAGNPARAD